MSLRESVRDIAEQAGRQHNCRLYDVYSHRDRFQVFIERLPELVEGEEKKEFVNLEDCEKVFNSLSFLIQSQFPDFFKKWRLEVSSPGLDRKLRERWHFKESLGLEIKIKTFEPVRGVHTQTKREWRTASFTGELISFEGDILKLQKEFVQWEVPFLQVKMAQRVFLLPDSSHQVKHTKRKSKKTKRKKRGR